MGIFDVTQQLEMKIPFVHQVRKHCLHNNCVCLLWGRLTSNPFQEIREMYINRRKVTGRDYWSR